jgi:hypothetical protein
VSQSRFDLEADCGGRRHGWRVYSPYVRHYGYALVKGRNASQLVQSRLNCRFHS